MLDPWVGMAVMVMDEVPAGAGIAFKPELDMVQLCVWSVHGAWEFLKKECQRLQRLLNECDGGFRDRQVS